MLDNGPKNDILSSSAIKLQHKSQSLTMNRQSGSLAPIPVTPKTNSPSQQPLLEFPPPPLKQKRRSREGRRSWLSFPNRPRNSPIWRPSTGHSPPTPQWPLPRQPISEQLHPQQHQEQQYLQRPIDTRDNEPNPAMTMTYTRPREAPQPPPPASTTSSRSNSTTPTLTDDACPSPHTNLLPPHPLSPRFTPSPPRPSYAPTASAKRNASFQTRYMNMAMSTQRIPRSHNILSNLFAWMMLLAFIIAPANFCRPPPAETGTVTARWVGHGVMPYRSVPSVGLLAASCTMFGVGMLGMVWLALCWRRNFIWLMNRIYLPLMLNSLAGLIASLVIVDIQDGMWFSDAAYVSLAIEGTTLVLSGALFFYTNYLLLGKLKREHARETSTKNVVELVKAGKRPPFAPGSVV